VNTQDFKVGDMVWTMTQTLEDSQYNWVLLEPRKVKITEIAYSQFAPYVYHVYQCDENGKLYNQCLCKPDELYKTEEEAKTAYKDEIQYQINKLKREILYWEKTLLDLQS